MYFWKWDYSTHRWFYNELWDGIRSLLCHSRFVLDILTSWVSQRVTNGVTRNKKAAELILMRVMGVYTTGIYPILTSGHILSNSSSSKQNRISMVQGSRIAKYCKTTNIQERIPNSRTLDHQNQKVKTCCCFQIDFPLLHIHIIPRKNIQYKDPVILKWKDSTFHISFITNRTTQRTTSKSKKWKDMRSWNLIS